MSASATKPKPLVAMPAPSACGRKTKPPRAASSGSAARLDSTTIRSDLDVQVLPDCFGLGEVIDRGGAVFATETGVARSAPGQPYIGIAIGVDPHRAGLRVLGETLHASDVVAPDAGRQTVGGAVGDPQCIGLI